MRWVRSWPRVIPPGRAYVVDDMERIVLDDYDYTPLGKIDEDVIVIEWDMALSREDRDRFARIAERHPRRVIVAPYKLYHVADQPVWAHRLVDRHGRESWVQGGETYCDYFGFGLIYLPRELVRAFLAAPAPERGRSPFLLPSQSYTDSRFHDQTFSVWLSRAGDMAHIAWDVRPVHLHY